MSEALSPITTEELKERLKEAKPFNLEELDEMILNGTPIEVHSNEEINAIMRRTEQLKVRQYKIPGRGDQGSHTMLYAGRHVDGHIKITVPENTIHVTDEDFEKLYHALFPNGSKDQGTI